MKKGNAIWALSLCLILGACASSGEPTSTTAAAAEVPPLIARMRALEAEMGTVAAKKVWSAQLTGASEVKNAWLDGSTLLIEAYNAETKDYEIYSVDAAKNGKLGLWADPNPIPPWEWRKQKSPAPAPRASLEPNSTASDRCELLSAAD